MRKIVLASKSPRRKEILQSLKIPFQTITSDFDESICDIKEPSSLVKNLSQGKAESVMDLLKEPSLVIGSDTIVVFNNMILGKPKNEEEAFEFISMLEGKKHEVYSGIAIVDTESDNVYVNYEKTNVYMRHIKETEIQSYIKSGEPMDKAGAYGIQGIGSVFIERIEGDFYSVMGFPILKLYEGLNSFDINLFDFQG
ncbi:septum formation protein [Natranaerovirga pectinivora]|uniref:dTTP/UTP pyrophosphatase n=1 Tax=Natranaerovirga pectinivora TaxID=682400 RepID=A0A4R3MKJ9_9FIRM|nr:Maf family protein [Natranaerovirga pectinivora]TCT14973.1 septum formation protein [Natranaerovirga pectinivora]